MKKLNRSHTTYIERSEKVLKYLHKIDKVSKVSLGLIKVKRPSTKTHGPFKLKLTTSHLLLEVNSKNANQKIHIYGENLKEVAKDVKKFLKESGEGVIFEDK